MPQVTESNVDQQRQLAAILASTHEAVIASTRSGEIISWNPAAMRLYGYAAEEIIGKNIDVLRGPERRQELAQLYHRVLGSEPMVEYNTSQLCKNGDVVEVSATTSAVVDTVGAVVGAVTVSRGLGEPPHDWERLAAYVDEHRATLDVDLRALQAQLQQAQRLEALGQLAGGVAHDFNNLLGVILNYATFVSEEIEAAASVAPDWNEREAAQRDVVQIRRAAERATDLTHQLLAFARREVVQPRVLNLNDVVREVEGLLRRTIGEEINLVTNLPDELLPILADPGQLEQVLVNLSLNARDAMPNGGVLRIETANLAVDSDSVAGGSPAKLGQYVRLRVSDTGTGITEDVIEHAFEPFFTTKVDGAGTGLGLATVYGIVTQADATITIQSELGAGTTFTIMLPVTEEAAVAIEEPAPDQRDPKGETVLVVEDEEALREVTERIFARNGYQVLTAANGPDAIDLATRHDGDIHLLLTDVVMPRMLGKEVAERVHEVRPEIKVLFMSGYAQPVLASQGRLDPGVVLVDKPFSEADLLAKAGEVLNGHFQGFRTVSAPARSGSRPSVER